MEPKLTSVTFDDIAAVVGTEMTATVELVGTDWTARLLILQ
ncbi:hypothetical protein [Burkholderia sp. AU30198]|nr:hypothetical protein [Burkholderia sp. AU30198]